MRTWAAILILSTLPARSNAQSLGEVARKEKERQKQGEEGTKTRVFTNEDLLTTKGRLANNPDDAPARVSGGAEPPAPAHRPGSVTVAIPATPRPPSSGYVTSREPMQGGEAAWRGHMSSARARLEAAKKQYERVQAWVVGIPGTSFVDRTTGRPVSDKRVLQEIAAAKAEVEAAQKAIDDLEERARRESVPPGWLR